MNRFAAVKAQIWCVAAQQDALVGIGSEVVEALPLELEPQGQGFGQCAVDACRNQISRHPVLERGAAGADGSR